MALITELLPELDPMVLAGCLVRDPREVAWTLRQLEDVGGRIALFDANEPARRVPARLATVTSDQVEFAGSGEPLNGHDLMVGSRILVVGHLRDIKIQFEVVGATRTGSRNDPALRCRLPETLYRIQRRASHRVRIDPVDGIRLRMKVDAPHPSEAGKRVKVEKIYPVVDLSTDGVCFQWSREAPAPEMGTRFGEVWLESKDWEPIASWLEVVRVTGSEKAVSRTIGCHLGVAPESATTLARSLISLQRRGKS